MLNTLKRKMIAKRGNREIWQKEIYNKSIGTHVVIYRQLWSEIGGTLILSPDDGPFYTPEAAWEWLNQG